MRAMAPHFDMYSIERKRTTPARLAFEFAHDCPALLLSNSRDVAENLVKWVPNLAGARFRFYALPSSLPLGFTFQQRPNGPHTYVKATSRLRSKMVSHSLPFPISFRGTSHLVSTAQPCATIIKQARPNHRLDHSRNWLAEPDNALSQRYLGMQTRRSWDLIHLWTLDQVR
jgi:hypothetical protein